MSGIYIHIPYCKQACHYCDFHFSTKLSNKEQMLEAMLLELVKQNNYLNASKVETLYFGGGTPSLLSPDELSSFINKVRNQYALAEDAEITLEANPDDLDIKKLREYHKIGINRLSIGVQSFHDQLLNYFNRSHDSKMAIQAVKNAQDIGITNISVDLIFGVPNQTIGQLGSDLDQLIELNLSHISIYGLTIEEKTVFGKWFQQGRLKPIDEELAREHFILIMEFLEREGFDHYEISNFAKPGFESRHNSSYWTGQKYLGIGPAAHSYNGDYRHYNVSHNSKYIKGMLSDDPLMEIEHLTRNQKITEYILTAIRTTKGLDIQVLKDQYSFDLIDEKQKEISGMIESNHIFQKGQRLLLTKGGKLLCDPITELLIP